MILRILTIPGLGSITGVSFLRGFCDRMPIGLVSNNSGNIMLTDLLGNGI